MRLSRRGVLLSSAAALTAAAAAGAYGLLPGGMVAHALDVIARVYGPAIAAEPASREFAEAYERFVLEKGAQGQALNGAYRLGLDHLPLVRDRLAQIDDSIVYKFATSTNVILATETGVPLVFVTLYQPYITPCASQLGANAIA
jgi:hypothetical protein